MSTQPPGALPMYQRIAEQITIDIRAGHYTPGTRLPPERALARAHGVTVTTLRKSLKVLTDRGFLERRHGSGNYIRDGRTDLGAYAFFRLELPRGGGLPTAAILSLSKVSKPHDVPDLGSDAAEAWNIRRVRSLNHAPVAIEDIWLDGRFTGDLSAQTASESLYRSYHDRLGLIISRVEDKVGTGALPPWATGLLDTDEDRDFGLVRRRAFDGYGTLAEVSTTWFDPDRAAYVARIP